MTGKRRVVQSIFFYYMFKIVCTKYTVLQETQHYVTKETNSLNNYFFKCILFNTGHNREAKSLDFIIYKKIYLPFFKL